MSGPGRRPLLAVAADPLLARFNAAGLLSVADVHVARRLGRLTGEGDPQVLLAVALTVREVRAGSVCLTLAQASTLPGPEVLDDDDADDAGPAGRPGASPGPVPEPLNWPEPGQWQAAVQASPMVAVGAHGQPERPVRLVDGRLYLDRYWRDEELVRAQTTTRLQAGDDGPAPLRLSAAAHRLFPRPEDGRQRLAAAAAALGRLTVVTGGPGTGKTTTVARICALLQTVHGPGLRVALAAPTGKAAARLQEAVQAEVGQLAEADRRAVGRLTATTVHRLLGWQPDSSTRFRHRRDRHLPHDLVVVDETSMVSLPLMARLLEALRPDARLVLVGDPDQLASVEAGAVLGDLVHRPAGTGALPELLGAALPQDLPGTAEELAELRNGVVRLVQVHRHGSEIAELARAVREGDGDATLAVLQAGGAAVTFVPTGPQPPTEAQLSGLQHDAVRAGTALVRAARAGDVAGALRALEAHRLLLAHRSGPFGVGSWASQVESWVAQALPGPAAAPGPWYPGRPLLVTRNDRDSGLFNGDTGVVVEDGQGLVAAFGDPDRPLLVRPHRLPACESVHAMTVHRGQGSQFARVSVLLPPATSPLLTRELLYTAVTRAREGVRLIGSADGVRAAVGRPVRRASGLRAR